MQKGIARGAHYVVLSPLGGKDLLFKKGGKEEGKEAFSKKRKKKREIERVGFDWEKMLKWALLRRPKREGENRGKVRKGPQRR